MRQRISTPLPKVRRARFCFERSPKGWLAALGGVDAGQADAVLDLVAVEHGQGVAVGDADDAVFEEIGGGWGGQQEQKA